MNSKNSIKDILMNLELGSSIAELDTLLDSSYVESSVLTDFLGDRYNIIRGAKGTGKSALLLYVYNNRKKFIELQNTILIKANEHQGDPSFKKAFGKLDSESNIEIYAEAWKIYLINLIWPEIKYIVEDGTEIERYMQKKKVLTNEKGFLGRLMHAVLRAKASITVENVEYSFQLGQIEESEYFVDYNYIFSELNHLLEQNSSRTWILLDRLDDAFPDWTESSLKAIKSLFYVYKDIMGLKYLKLKTFIRTDIFDRITNKEGFTSLSHIKAVTSAPIVWDELRIKKFIVNRFKSVIQDNDDSIVVKRIMGDQVDVGKKQPDSFHWLLNHLKDGNQIYTPRDILDFFDTARQCTLKEIESDNNFAIGSRLFSKSSMKLSWGIVSKNKCETQLYAENPELRDYIEMFRSRKSEYSTDAIRRLLGDNFKNIVDQLVYIGFLGNYGENWKVPFLYRPCLEIKQGKM